nr:hypothetical protein [Tanacetum cinerariifolium]
EKSDFEAVSYTKIKQLMLDLEADSAKECKDKQLQPEHAPMTLKSELFAEALCKVHGEIGVELKDESNATDLYKPTQTTAQKRIHDGKHDWTSQYTN